MLKQLENQKNDASKRLEDLNSQVWKNAIFTFALFFALIGFCMVLIYITLVVFIFS